MLGLVADVMRKSMRVEASSEAVDYILRQGGRLWVWAARPRLCCWGTPAYMYTSTEPPRGLTGFDAVSSAPPDLEIWFRAPAGRFPDVLEIGMRGRRRPRVEAYWDGCVIAL
jgi:hypothetical protein